MAEATTAPEASGERIRAEFADLERQLADPALHQDPSRSRVVGRRYARLAPIVRALDAHDGLAGDLEAARELADEDPAFSSEVERLEAALAESDQNLARLLAPSDPNDICDAIMEIKSGAGGEESALFAGDLLRMYEKYCEQKGWHIEVLDSQQTDLGGYKSVTFLVRGASHEEVGPYGELKFEGGVHRVQRIPVTESQGRIHTSAAGVLVMPDVEPDEVHINDDDLRVDVYRSSGPGGQGVNTTDSAVRITHLLTGIVVTCQNQRSQIQNREQAMRMLRSRLVALAEEEAAQSASEARRSQVRTVDRSERVRTYNFPENRIADHRIGYKAHNLDAVLGGDLGDVIHALQEADLAERLAHAGVR